jgi:hypothetical protein
MIQEYYRQMRKFGCNILAVVQQYDIIKDSPVRGAMIGNSKMLSTVGFISSGHQEAVRPDRSSESVVSGLWNSIAGDGSTGARAKWQQPVVMTMFKFGPIPPGDLQRTSKKTAILESPHQSQHYLGDYEPC